MTGEKVTIATLRAQIRRMRPVYEAAMAWNKWEKKSRVSPMVWPREIDLFDACEKARKQK